MSAVLGDSEARTQPYYSVRRRSTGTVNTAMRHHNRLNKLSRLQRELSGLDYSQQSLPANHRA